MIESRVSVWSTLDVTGQMQRSVATLRVPCLIYMHTEREASDIENSDSNQELCKRLRFKSLVPFSKEQGALEMACGQGVMWRRFSSLLPFCVFVVVLNLLRGGLNLFPLFLPQMVELSLELFQVLV